MSNVNQQNKDVDDKNQVKQGILSGQLDTALQEALEKVRKNLDQDKFEEIDQVLQNPVKAGSKMIIDEARQALQDTANGILNSSKVVVDKVSRTASNTIVASINLAKSSGQNLPILIAKINKSIGANPEEQEKLSDFFIKNGPIIGTIGSYASGWKAYHTGKEKNDLEMQNKGRELCLSALLNLGIDSSTLGMSFLARNAHAAIKTSLGVLTLPTISKFLGGADPVMFFAKKLLSNSNTKERAQVIVDFVLESIQPEGERIQT
jgi:hypothetical protein